jgi:hypothetical protein
LELFNRASADAGANGTIARLPQARFGFDASS